MSAPVQQLGIAVAVDGSPASNAAAYWAAREAAMRHCPLTIVHAVSTPTTMYPPVPYPEALATNLEDESKQAILHATKIAEEAMPADRQVPIGRKLLYSAPVPALLELSGAVRMLVLGSAGHGLLARGLLGSVSSAVVRHANCPVAVVRDEELPDPHSAPVLLGTDGSPASELATEIAFDEASRRGVDLVAIHAWSDTAVTEVFEIDWPIVEAEAERHLAESLAGWRERYPDVTVHRLVARDRAAQHIISSSETAQLVVVGSHGRGGLARLLLGSVSNAVLHSVRVPVIVARPPA